MLRRSSEEPQQHPAHARALAALLATLSALGGCSSCEKDPKDRPDAARSDAGPATVSQAAPDAGTLVDASVGDAPSGVNERPPWLPSLSLGPAAPLRIIGYPTKLVETAEGFHHVGWTREGDLVGCILYWSRGCILLDRDKKERRGLSFPGGDVDPASDKEKVRTRAALTKFIQDEHLLELVIRKEPDGMATLLPPAFAPVMPLGSALTLHVEQREGTASHPGSVRLGGALREHGPVWIWSQDLGADCITEPVTCSQPQLNAIIVSPDGRALGLFVTNKRMSDVVSNHLARLDLDAFAAQVFNDTALGDHRKKEYARSAELFASAVFLAPRSPLFTYNLACAWARLRDPRGKDALARAIELGGDKIQARAARDADFDPVRSEGWFKEAIAPRPGPHERRAR